jgi:cell fate regulator YaaT (PSP1 superfamily)
LSIYLAVFGKPRYLGLVDIKNQSAGGTWVLLKTMRGLEMGLLGGALSPEQEEKYRRVGVDEADEASLHGAEPMLQEVTFVSFANDEEVENAAQNHASEDEALIKSRVLLAGHKLPIKLVEVEYLFDKKKLFFYFTSDYRVDFRAYVRDLAREFRTRIEMRQIGVRDEARSAKGISQCGRPCCCSYWLHKFTPICIRMVKEQNLALNPTKISGLCGRLMCCMSFEHSMYEEIWKKLPNPGSKLKTPNGNYIVDGVDLKSKSVLVRFPEGKDISIPVADFDRFKQTVLSGEPWDQSGDSIISRIQGSRLGREEENKENSDIVRRARQVQKQEKISLDEHLAVRDSNSKENTESKKNTKRVTPKTDEDKEGNEKNIARKHKLHKKKLRKHNDKGKIVKE